MRAMIRDLMHQKFHLGLSKLQSGGYRFAISKHARVEIRHHNKDIGFNLIDFFNGSMNFDLGLVNQPYFPEDGGVVWLRFVGGLMRLQVKEVQLRNYPQLDGESIRGIYVDDEYAVVTTYTGVYKSAGALGESEMYKIDLGSNIGHYPGAGVYKFKDTLWVALDYRYAFYLTENSLQLARPPVDKLIKCHNYSESTHAFMRDSRGRLLLNTKSGILKYSRKEESFLPYLLPNDRVYYSIEHNDSIYATTDRGIINLKSNTLFKIKKANGSTLKVLHIHADKKGYFWLSTDQGLYRWLPGTQQIHAFTSSYGLPTEKTYGCLVDNSGRFWLSTDVGLFVIDFEKKVSFSFNRADGMPHDECNNFSFFKDRNGRMYFGTIRGLFSVHPDSIATPLDAKNQVWVDDISTLRSNGTFLSVLNEYLQDGVLKLRKKDRQVQISFSSPSYSRLIKAYKWRIPSISASWETTSDNRISFYGLPYGKHQLEIVPLGTKAYSFDSKLVTRIPIYVIRPFYSSWYFILMLFFVLVGVAILVIKWRLQSVERKNIQLNALVTEKTKALIQQNEVVSQQKEEIERLYELKNRHLAHLNHELRTPLTIIKGYIREIKNAIQGQAEVLKALIIMERNADQLFDLTEDVLELARLDAGTVTLNEEACEWQKFLRQISANFEGLASRKGICYNIEWDDIPEGLMVLVDRKKTERILNNLLMNALKFTLKGDSITIYSQCKAGTLQVKVRDTGSGIEQSDLSHIFDRYYQVLNNIDSTRPGFGIGLALCREYADLMGGSLQVESEWGVGSEFCLTLPLKPVPEQKGQVDDIDPSLMDSNMVFYTDSNDDQTLRPRLLIAEDSPDMQQYLYDVLSAHFEVSLANDGAIAWKMLKESKKPFDLVISDIMMPNMDGTMLLNKLRTSEKLSDMPFIFLTALAEQEQIIEALYLGVDSYLTKPFMVEELLARINNLLQYRMQRHQHQKNIQEEDKEDHTNLTDDVKWLKDLDAVLEKKIHFSDLKIDDLAHDFFVSERTFRTKIKTYSGLSPSDYLMKYRLRKALLLLEKQSYSNISQVCYAVGFKNASHFSKVFKAEYGKSPSDYLR